MLANTAAPATTTPAGGAITLTNGSTITYWIEERVKQGSTVLKRSIASSDTTSTVTGDGSTILPTFVQTHVNSDVTHIALYATATGGSFPTGAEIREVAATSTATTITDNRSASDPSLPTGSTYELWVANLLGSTQTTPRNGPPPIATTGDIFDDSLVLNDINNPSFVWFSWPDVPHSFPANNRIRFETKEHDEVTFIRRLGDIIIVGLRDALWRINVLPTVADAVFDRGRVKDEIEGAFGIPGPLAADTFSFGQGKRLAYASVAGPMIASGGAWDTLTDDVDWETEVEISRLPQSVMINNPKQYRLEFYYTPKGGTQNTACMYFHYHKTHLKAGNKLKATWPINVKAVDAMRATLNSDRIIFTASDNKLWQENKGDIDNSNAGGIQFDVRTGDMFTAGVGGEAAPMDRWWVHHQAHPGQTADCTVVMRNEGKDDVEVTKPISLNRREITQTPLTAQAEALQLGVSNSDSKGSIGIDYFSVEIRADRKSEEG
jgi:hypothetical protein